LPVERLDEMTGVSYSSYRRRRGRTWGRSV